MFNYRYLIDNITISYSILKKKTYLFLFLLHFRNYNLQNHSQIIYYKYYLIKI